MSATITTTRDEAQIRKCIDEIAQAIRTRDINTLMTHYAPDVLVFDMMPLQTQGREAYQKNFEAWFTSVKGPIDFTMRDWRVVINDAVAFCHYLAQVGCLRTTGARTDYTVRVTAGLREINRQWIITHEHVSLPFPDRETLQTAMTSWRSG